MTGEHVPASPEAIQAAAAVYRAILADPDRAAALREHRARQAAEQAAAVEKRHADD